MKNSRYIILIILLLLTVIVFLYVKKENTEVVYVRLEEVYDKFNMKTELERQFKSVEIKRKNLIDSLEFQAKQVQINGTKEQYGDAVELYVQKRRELENANDELSKQFDEQIWKQLNSYCKEFGKENNFKYVLGTDGSGTIMYADENNDVTQKLIDFINKRYNGGKLNEKK